MEPGLCATPAQLTQCEGLAQNATCDASAGYCDRGICLPNVCGDGQLTGNEVCDGVEVSLTCADFASYEGTLRCTSQCTLDRSGCVGTCGDGIVQQAEGEQCDGAAPTTSCVGYGGDFGQIACNEFCTPAFTTDCYRYGWRELLAPGASRLWAFAANRRGALGAEATRVRVRWDDVESTRDISVYAAGAGEDRFVVTGAAGSAWFDGTWHDMQDLPNYGDRLEVAGDVFYTKRYWGCTVFRGDMATGLVTPLPAAPVANCGPDLVALDRNRIVVPSGLGLLHWDGVSWTTLAIGAVTGIASTSTPGLLAAHLGPQRVDIDLTQTPAQVIPRRSALGNYLFVDADDNDVDYAFDEGSLFGQLVVDGVATNLAGPEGSVGNVGVSFERSLLAAAAGVYSFDPHWLRNDVPYPNQIYPLADGAVAFCGYTIGALTSTGPLGPAWSTANGPCLALAGDPRGEHFVAAGTGGIWRFDTATGTYVKEWAGVANSIAGDATEAVSHTLERVGTTWVSATMPTVCTSIYSVTGHPGHIYGVAACNGTTHLLRRTQGAWVVVTPLPAGALPPVVAQDGSVFVSGQAATYRLDGASFVAVAGKGPVAAASAEDFFVRTSQSAYEHHRGASVSQVRVQAIGPFIVTPRALHAIDPNTGIYTLPRMPSRYAAAGL